MGSNPSALSDMSEGFNNLSIGLARITPKFIYVGADSQITYNDSDAYNDVDIKIFEANGVVGTFAGETPSAALYKAFVAQQDPDRIALTGDFMVMLELVREFKKYLSEFDMALVRGNEIVGHAIFVTKEKAWLIEDNFIQDADDYMVIGSGDVHARAVLYTGGSVHAALDTACRFNVHCSYPIIIYQVNRKTGETKKRIIKHPSDLFIPDSKLFVG